MFSNFGTKRTVHRWEVSAVLCSKISLGRLMLWTCEIQDTQCTIFMQKLKESSQIEHTPQDSISEFIIRKLNALVVVDFRFISAFLHVCAMSCEFTRKGVAKFLPAQFSWKWCWCLLTNLIHSSIFNLTKYREVFVKYSLLITHAGMPIWIWH